MAPKYLMRIVREPLPGKAFELMDAVSAQRAQSGITNGVTSVSVAAPKMVVISSTPYESLEEIQTRIDGIFESPEARASWDSVGALAKSTVNALSTIIEVPDGIEEAIYTHHFRFQHRPDSRRRLIDALREFRAHDVGQKIGITASMNTNYIVASQALRSLSELEESGDRLREDMGTIARATAVANQSEGWTAAITKVISRP